MNGVNDNRAAKNANFDTNQMRRRIVIVTYDGVNSLDVSGPSSVFARANELAPASYEILHASPTGEKVCTQSGIVFADLAELCALTRPIDTIMVAGGGEKALRKVIAEGRLTTWLNEMASSTRRLGSVCTGAFILAAAGLLNNHRAVTHWASCAALEDNFPDVDVQPDALFIIENGIFTSAGVSASIDVSLALVEQDLGCEIAKEIAKSMVLFLRRSGGQSQYSNTLIAQMRVGAELSGLLSWIADNLTLDLSVPKLAVKAGMSERTFIRKFTAETDQTPAAYVRTLRLETARHFLETTRWPVKRVAQMAGFGSVDGLERAIQKRLKTSPSAIRNAYGVKR